MRPWRLAPAALAWLEWGFLFSKGGLEILVHGLWQEWKRKAFPLDTVLLQTFCQRRQLTPSLQHLQNLSLCGAEQGAELPKRAVVAMPLWWEGPTYKTAPLTSTQACLSRVFIGHPKPEKCSFLAQVFLTTCAFICIRSTNVGIQIQIQRVAQPPGPAGPGQGA